MQQPSGRGDTESDAFAELLRGSVVPTVAVGLLAVVVGAFSGPRAAWSAAFGAALVLVFFTVSLLALKLTASLPPSTVLLVALGTYTAKVLALGVTLLLVRDALWLSGYAVGVTVLLCALVWLYFETRAYKRLRIFAFDSPPPRPEGGR